MRYEKIIRLSLLLILIITSFLFLFLYKQTKVQETKKTLWAHLVYTEIKKNHQHNYNRTTLLSHGLFNQLYSLFSAVDVAILLKRELVVDNFYVHYMDTTHCVPLSKIIDLSSLLVPTTDWKSKKEEPVISNIATHVYDPPPNSFKVLLSEKKIPHLEVGCLFNFSVPHSKKEKHIQSLRFHPIFYEMTASFRSSYSHYQVVHYRMEDDFSGYFHQRFGYQDTKELQTHLFHKYQKTMKKHFDPNIPTLVVSHYYKQKQPRQFDLPWKNIIHFSITKQQKEQLYHHLDLPTTIAIREVEAIFDFVLSTSPNVRGFIGCEVSTFSESIVSFWNKKDCVLIHPQK